MKKELILVLESNSQTYQILQHIKDEGFNATVVSTESLRHALDYYPGEHHFFNLRHLENHDVLESVLCVFVVNDNRLDALKEVIRLETNSFSSIKGFMYSRNIEDYEGSI